MGSSDSTISPKWLLITQFAFASFTCQALQATRQSCFGFTRSEHVKKNERSSKNYSHDRLSFQQLLRPSLTTNWASVVDLEEEEGALAQSEFGTKRYWDDMYDGRGHFDADQYSWYFGWETIKSHWKTAITLLDYDKNNNTKKLSRQESNHRIFLPGIGNDSDLICHLYNSGYKDITAIDYSDKAIQKQYENLAYMLPPEALMDYDSTSQSNHESKSIRQTGVNLFSMDMRALEPSWSNSFDFILEKGALDAVFLSCENEHSIENLEKSIKELTRVIRSGGVLVSVSGVVPHNLRQQLLPETDWEWIRDGINDLKAGCFIFRKRLK